MTTSHEAIVESHIKRWITMSQLSKKAQKEKDRETELQTVPPSITFSHAYGSGAEEIVEDVSRRLHYQILDREIMDAICQSTSIQRKIIEALDKGSRRHLPYMHEQIFSKQVIDDTSYLNILIRIVRFIALLGPAIYIGRGTCHILRESKALNIRIVADFEDRVARIMKTEKKERKDAEQAIEDDDSMRRRFIRNYFKKNIDDPTAYHLMINASRIPATTATEMILEAYSPE